MGAVSCHAEGQGLLVLNGACEPAPRWPLARGHSALLPCGSLLTFPSQSSSEPFFSAFSLCFVPSCGR